MTQRGPNLPPLGELELGVLQHLWSIEPHEADVQDVHAAIGRTRGITLNTVGSALERLHRKQLLTREKVSHSFRYRPTVDQASFRARKVLEAAGGPQALGKRGLLAAFVDLVADVDGDALSELEALVKAKRATERKASKP